MRLKTVFVAAFAVISLSIPTLAQTPDNPEFIRFDSSLMSGERFRYMSGGGSDRCVEDHCMCRVSRPRYTPEPTPVALKSRRLAIPFAEGSHAFSEADQKALEKYAQSFSQYTTFTIVGYTDDCGTHEYNEQLVHRRVSQVRSALKKLGHTQVSATQFHAEASKGHDPASRRVDVIAHTKSRLTTMIEKVQADVYLIDASGSMWEGWRDWSNLVAASFKPNSKIYLSQTVKCAPSRIRLDQARPAGGTEIWYSYWKILEWMKPGETLAIISDFRSDVPLTNREAVLIQQKVESRQIKVIAISP